MTPGCLSWYDVDRDGNGIRKLANGHLWAPPCSDDGRFVFYVTTEQPQKIWRVSIEGGNSEEVAEVMGNQVTGRLAVSHEGVLLAYPYTQYGRVPSDGWQVAIIRATFLRVYSARKTGKPQVGTTRQVCFELDVTVFRKRV
jgi:hypothetical protein